MVLWWTPYIKSVWKSDYTLNYLNNCRIKSSVRTDNVQLSHCVCKERVFSPPPVFVKDFFPPNPLFPPLTSLVYNLMAKRCIFMTRCHKTGIIALPGRSEVSIMTALRRQLVRWRVMCSQQPLRVMADLEHWFHGLWASSVWFVSCVHLAFVPSENTKLLRKNTCASILNCVRGLPDSRVRGTFNLPSLRCILFACLLTIFVLREEEGGSFLVLWILNAK